MRGRAARSLLSPVTNRLGPASGRAWPVRGWFGLWPPPCRLAGGLRDWWRLLFRARNDLRVVRYLLCQRRPGLLVGQAVAGRARHGDHGDRAEHSRSGSHRGAEDGLGRLQQEPATPLEFGTQAVTQNRFFKPMPRCGCEPDRQDGVYGACAKSARASWVDANGDRDNRPVPQVDAVGADAEPAERSP